MTTIPRNNKILLSVTILISLCIIIAFVTITQHQSNLQENSDVSAQRTIIDTPLMMSSQQPPQQPRKHTMVGGYSNLGHDDKKLLQSEEVVKVANFALKEYAAKTTGETETATSSSSGEQHDSLTVSPEEVESGEVTAVVLEAHRQVVAGLNYKLTIALMKEDSNNICLGAIKVTVYDHFGELQVTKWGDKLPCEEVHELLEQVQQVEVEEQKEEEKALEVEGEIEDGMEEVEPNE